MKSARQDIKLKPEEVRSGKGSKRSEKTSEVKNVRGKKREQVKVANATSISYPCN
jgi:hypothetical protein